MSDWGLLDMRAAVDAGAERAQGAPGLHTGPQHRWAVSGTAEATTRSRAPTSRSRRRSATGAGKHAPFSYLAWWFWRVHGPLMLAVKGYIPTRRWLGGIAAAARRIRRVAALVPAARSLRPGPRDLSIRQLVRRHPRATAHASGSPTIRSPRARPSRSSTRSSRTRGANRAGIRRRTPAAKRIGHEGFFASRHRDTLWRPGPRLDRRQARSGRHEPPHGGGPRRTHHSLRPPRARRGDARSRCSRRTRRNEGLIDYFGAELHAELAKLARATTRASARHAPRRGGASTSCPASWVRSSASCAAANAPTTSCGSIPSTSRSADSPSSS